jgi:quercetin dioxygenase-like cupin family protein
MQIRRIVTGHTESGKSVFMSDGTAPRSSKFLQIPGMWATLAWLSQADGCIANGRSEPTAEADSVLPLVVGQSSLLIVTFPPDSVRSSSDFDRMAAGAETARLLPGLAQKFEPSAPGMHTTETVDYGILLDGELTLELDDGATKNLGVHDIVIQNGTRHAWRNLSTRPATMLFVLIGARHG